MVELGFRMGERSMWKSSEHVNEGWYLVLAEIRPGFMGRENGGCDSGEEWIEYRRGGRSGSVAYSILVERLNVAEQGQSAADVGSFSA